MEKHENASCVLKEFKEGTAQEGGIVTFKKGNTDLEQYRKWSGNQRNGP
jgi:hypothetical protein